VLTCCRVLLDRQPILSVTHERDGDWQLLCGGTHEPVNDDGAKVVHLNHLLERDASLQSVMSLARGVQAERDGETAPWVRRGAADDEVDNSEHPADCACCNEHGKEVGPDGFDAAERKCINDIQEYGLHIFQIAASDEDDGFSYSVGLFDRYAHPEIIVFGQKASWQYSMLKLIAEKIADGTVFEPSHLYSDLREGYSCRFHAVRTFESLRDYVGWDLWYYRTVKKADGLFPLLQFVWPDREGRFPDQPGYESYLQPLLL